MIHNNAYLCGEIFGCCNKEIHVFRQLNVVNLFVMIRRSSTYFLSLKDNHLINTDNRKV